MTCVVTAGPTYEPLDQVRRLTNFSTGKLGLGLASHLAAQGHRVILLKGYYAIYQGPVSAQEVIRFTTTADLAARLKALAQSPVGAVFHAAAVNDFGFGKTFRRTATGDLEPLNSDKFSTRSGPLLVELIPTTKIIQELRTWFGSACLVGWKYEVEGAQDDAIRAATEQVQRCHTDGCVVNGTAYGEGFGFVSKGGACQHLPDSASHFKCLSDLLVH